MFYTLHGPLSLSVISTVPKSTPVLLSFVSVRLPPSINGLSVLRDKFWTGQETRVYVSPEGIYCLFTFDFVPLVFTSPWELR